MKPIHDQESVYLSQEQLTSPLLEKLAAITNREIGIRFLIVFPKSEGWGQFIPGGAPLPEFCRLVQSGGKAAKHCWMCHVLQAAAACIQGPTVQRCHMGVSALAQPASRERDVSPALLSSCMLVSEEPAGSWEVVRRRAEKLDIDLPPLRKAYQNLPRLSPGKIAMARALLDLAGEALKEIKARVAAEAALKRTKELHSPSRDAGTVIERELRQALSTLQVTRQSAPGDRPQTSSALIDVVSTLVADKPNIQFSVGAMAAACRMTPNHFSYLFHRQHKQCFSAFVSERRLALAKDLMKDLTLDISEVALKAGFKDAGYFARRFKQENRLSPREWRGQLARPKGRHSPRSPALRRPVRGLKTRRAG